MTDSFSAVQRSEELVSALSERRDPPVLDPAVEALLAIAAYADTAPGPRLEEVRERPVQRVLGGRRRLGLAIGVALACSSSGIAAAVTGDPLAPVTFVVKQLSELGHLGNEDNSSHLGGEPLSPPEADQLPTAVHDEVSAQRADRPQREHDRLVVPPPRSRGVDAAATTKRAPAGTSFRADERAGAPQPAAEPDSHEPTSDTPAVSHESSRPTPRPEAPAQPQPAEPQAEFADPRPAESQVKSPADPRPAEPQGKSPADPRPAEPRKKDSGEQEGKPSPDVLAAAPPASRHQSAAGPRRQPTPEPRRVVPKPPAADPCSVEPQRPTDCVRVRVPTPGEVLPDVSVPGANATPQSRQNSLPRQEPAAERSPAAVR